MARIKIPSNSECLATLDWNYYLYVIVDQYGREISSFKTESDARKYRWRLLKINPKALIFIQRLHNTSVLL